jgi:hypothetical protein
MPVFDLFSKRQKRSRGDAPDVFVYDSIPPALRVQVIHIWRNTIGDSSVYNTPALDLYRFLNDTLCEEYGVFRLAQGSIAEEIVANFFLHESEIDRVLDVIELSFQIIDRLTRDESHAYPSHRSVAPDDAIEELNTRFLEHGVGYQFVSGELVRKDSEFLHRDVIVPTLGLLHDKRYKGAEDEFRKAHEHYRHGRTKECLAECLKSLESALKTIYQIRKWRFNATDTAKPLLDVCFQNGLVPAFLQSHYTALRSTIESGPPVLRNKLGGHGQGSQVVDVPPHYAAYMLHMTGSAIYFLVQCESHL